MSDLHCLLCNISNSNKKVYWFPLKCVTWHAIAINVNVACVKWYSFMQGWKAFFEEPIMLIAFVLLGRNLEQRAKIKATSDMTGLLSILPSKARLLVSNDTAEFGSSVEVPSDSLSVGDQILVLPGVSNIESTFYQDKIL